MRMSPCPKARVIIYNKELYRDFVLSRQPLISIYIISLSVEVEYI